MFTLFDVVDSIDRPEEDFPCTLSILRLATFEIIPLGEKTSFSEVPDCIFFGHEVGVHFNLGFVIFLSLIVDIVVFIP